MSYTKIVETGPKEPTAKELEMKQAEILERLRSVTPDQLKEFQSRSVDEERAGEVKLSWQKTIWAK